MAPSDLKRPDSKSPEKATNTSNSSFWSLESLELLSQIESSSEGLSSDVAAEQLARNGATRLRQKRRPDAAILLAQFNNPIILLLAVSAVLSYLLDDATNAWIIFYLELAPGTLNLDLL